MIHTSKYYRLSLLVIILCSLVIISACSVQGKNTREQEYSKANQGVIALNESKDTEIHKLDGEWRFYWNRLLKPEEMNYSLTDTYVDVPSSWNKYKVDNNNIGAYGYATFELKVLNVPVDRSMALEVPVIFTAYRIWIDGKLLATSGEVGVNQQSTIPQKRSQIVHFVAQQPEVTLVIQVANFANFRGGMYQSIKLGDAKLIQSEKNIRLSTEMFLVGALFIMAVYHFVLHFIRSKEKSSIYFSFFCFFISIRSLFIGEVFVSTLIPNLSWTFGLRMEYLCLQLSFISAVLFLYSLFPQEMSKGFVKWTIIISLFFLLSTLSFETKIFTALLLHFQTLILLSVIIGSVSLAKAVLHRREGALLCSLGGVFLAAATFNDIFFYRGFIHTGNYISVGLFVCVLVQSIVLSRKFSKAFTSSEELAVKLASLNNTLEEKVMKRTDELEQLNIYLKRQTLIDGLTGIFNRRCFEQMLQKSWYTAKEQHEYFTVFLMDIDHFKSYNDTYGHLNGDACLKSVASTIQETANNAGGDAFRYGGEEFAVILRSQTKDQVNLLANLIIEQIRNLRIPHSSSITAEFVTISCGISMCSPSENVSPQEITQRADDALYRAKHSGRNCANA